MILGLGRTSSRLGRHLPVGIAALHLSPVRGIPCRGGIGVCRARARHVPRGLGMDAAGYSDAVELVERRAQ